MSEGGVGTLRLQLEDGSLATAEVIGEDGSIVGQLLHGEDPVQDVNTMFVLLSGFLVFFMHCGFAMLSVGAVRSKNAKNIILKILLDACFGAIAFYIFGFAFAFGGSYGDGSKGGKFIGWGGFALNGLPLSQYYMWFFQYAFAATAATIVSGAVAERTRFEAYILYAFFLTSWVYPVVAHWTWSNDGWASGFRATDRLFNVGVVDFAGCAAVHMVGGLSGLAGAWAVGPRIGRFTATGQAEPMPGHNASLAILGVFILWFGWYGFNPGSALMIIDSSSTAAVAAVTTTLSAAAGTLATLFTIMVIELVATGEIVWDLIGAANGTLAGLVGITASCAVVEPWAAIIIGATSGILYPASSYLVLNIMKVDDPLDAVAVHAFGGAWGLLMAAAFASKDGMVRVYGEEVAAAGHGFIMGGNGRILAAAIVIIIVVIGWTLLHMVPFFVLMRFLGLLRVPEDEEIQGLDVSHHGGSAYEGMNPSQKVANKSHKGAVVDSSVKASSLSDVMARLTNLESRNTSLEQELTQLRLAHNAQ